MSVSIPTIELICSVFGLLICSSIIIALLIKLIGRLRDFVQTCIIKADDKILGFVTAVALGMILYANVIPANFSLVEQK